MSNQSRYDDEAPILDADAGYEPEFDGDAFHEEEKVELGDVELFEDRAFAEIPSQVRPVPRISIECFCEQAETAETIEIAADDRRLSKAHVSIHKGDAETAVAHYQDIPSPSLIIVESSRSRDELLAQLDMLAECCDAGTKVIVIGRANDVRLYRSLLNRGVSDYLVAPLSPIQLMEAISNLYADRESQPVGNTIAFIGAKGGVGSSTLCHNVAWTMSELARSNVVIADLDLAFGTTGLDFNLDPVQGIAEALQSPERFDDQLLDRLLTKCTEHLSIFAAPAVLERDYDLSPDGCDTVIDVVRQNVPYVMLDLPNAWSDWSKRLLTQADEVVITAAPDLANLRNAKNLIDLLKASRSNDDPPHLVLNSVNMPKRPEIGIKEFCQSLKLEPIATIEFDAQNFGQAANNGEMIEQFNDKTKAVAAFHSIAATIMHRPQSALSKPAKASALAPWLAKLKLGK